MLGRAWLWLRSHPKFVDFLWMAPLLAFSLLTSEGPDGYSGQLVYCAFSLILCVPLIWRRQYPGVVFAIIAMSAFVQWLVGQSPIPADLAVYAALYTVAANCALRWAIAVGLVVELGAVLANLRWWKSPEGEITWGNMLPFTVFNGGTWILGIYISTRRAYLRSLEERAERLERERGTQMQIAAAAERARLAREMHDVVSHSISVMVVQADGAAYIIGQDPTRAVRAMEAVSATGRQALGEMRRMLGVLRREDDLEEYEPQPGIAQLTELVDQIGASGLRAELIVEGVPAELSPGPQLAVYRVVQEALTNTLKHGGPAAVAQVTLHYGDDALEIRVRDDGTGGAHAWPRFGRARPAGDGHGLVGMRERLAVYGGSVQAGPRPEGGYEVIARLPVREAADT